jgi:hypothetical protein
VRGAGLLGLQLDTEKRCTHYATIMQPNGGVPCRR